MDYQTVLITGASSGIGLHLAHEFARHGHSLILVAPDEAELRARAAEMDDAGIECIGLDLTQPEAAQQLFDTLAQRGLEVDVLCNNAGLGHRGKFWDQPIEQHLDTLRLNVEAVLRLTALFLPPMLQRARGRILNTASVAGFEPGPNMAVYHASKAFVLSWSEALATELEKTAVTVTALCPGATDTDFFPKAGLETTAAFQKGPLASPQEVAQAGYKALMDAERVVVVGAANKAMVFSRRFMSESMQAAINEKLYTDVPPEKRERVRGEREDEDDTQRRAG